MGRLLAAISASPSTWRKRGRWPSARCARIARDSLANANTSLSVIEAQARLGKISDLELAQQRTAVAGFQSAIPALEQQKTQALDALAVFLGSAPEGFGVNMPPLAGLTLPSIGAGLPSSLLERRPDVQKA